MAKIFKSQKYLSNNKFMVNSIRCYSKIDPSINDSLKNIFGANFSLAESIRQHHSKDESFHQEGLPDAVVFPEKVEQISALLKICNQKKIPVIPFGAGSGFEGGINALNGGITIDTSKFMDKILEINEEDFDCKVEAGVTREQLNHSLKETGLWFPIDPGANACLGGMTSTSASGTNAVRYGTMRENVLNIEAVLADGRVIGTAGKSSRSRKNVAGYNLTNLLCGSEGTLGVITKINLKLYPQPEDIISAVSTFPDINSAVQATVEIMQTGLPIARIEFLDEKSIHGNNVYSKLNLDVAPTLFLEFHGSKTTNSQQAEIAMDICKDNSCKDFKSANDLDERNKLWKSRYDIWFAFKSLYPNRKAISTDVCVPISNLPKVLLQTQKDIEELNLKTMIVGHVGDGNFHTFVSLDTSNMEEMKNYYEYTKRLVHHVLRLDGTCTGEHGIGLGKKKYLLDQFNSNTIDVMKSIKSTMDPNNILNPNKIFYQT